MVCKKIIISRTDGIGDVVLALPMAGVLKKLIPECKVIFLGRSYTKAIVDTCEHVDEFVAWDEIEKLDEQKSIQNLKQLSADVILHVFPRRAIADLAKKAGIPLRVGTSSRAYHWSTCNRLIRLSRRKSIHHEAQLNLKILVSLGAKKKFDLTEIPDYFGITKVKPLNDDFKKLLDDKKFNLLIHPLSKGSAREWGMKNFRELLTILPQNKFKIFISGTEDEGIMIRPFLVDPNPEVIDMTGKLSLEELISFISCTDGVLAASTGPLHIAAALGRFALGIYAPMRPIHPGRWAPIGKKAGFIVKEKYCSKCRNMKRCECIESITPAEVKEKILKLSGQ
jgi:ADP-heptose:LPS heptosyltransferase